MQIQGMDFITYNTRHIPTGKLIRCKMGLVKGRNLLLKAGFKKESPRLGYYPNKYPYFTKNDYYARYNSLSKAWFLEECNQPNREANETKI